VKEKKCVTRRQEQCTISVAVNLCIKSEEKYMTWFKFVAGALFGMGMFLFPAGEGEGFSTPVGLLTEWLEKLITANAPWFLYLLVAFSAMGALVCRFYMPEFIARRKWAAGLFAVSWPYLLTRLVALAVVI
jgi:nucleoside recognition membrane protein YjiH